MSRHPMRPRRRMPLRDRWRRWRAVGIPLAVRLSWAAADARAGHPTLWAAVALALACAAVWAAVQAAMAAIHG